MPEYYGRAEARQDWVDGMFDRTAGDYDWITDIMSFGSGRWYRRWALQRYGVSPGMRLLDVGSGTGVIAQAAQQQVGPEGAVVALDPSRGMLAQAGQAGVVAPVNARAEALPLGSNAFHRLTMGYALRHVDDLVATFSEFRRVLAPGGRLLLLEITPPRGRFGYRALRFYLRRVVPLIARLGRRSRDAELLMRYYWDTIDACVPPERILEALQAAGLEAVQRHVIGGIFSEYSGTKPASVDSSVACQADQGNA
jgi:demethylmenaquinone methyltransferase/2-methoxy-6-polyprenyl-1,4-benzoquinol methylase